MGRQLGALGVQPTEVHNAAHPGPPSRSHHILGSATFLSGEVLGETHRVHEVIHDVDAVECRLKRDRIVEVAAGDLNALTPRDARQLVWGSGQRPHREPAFEQARHQAPTDVAGGTGHQAPQLLRGHPRLRSSL